MSEEEKLSLLYLGVDLKYRPSLCVKQKSKMLGAEHLETREVDTYPPPPCALRHTLLQTGTLGSNSRLWQDLCNFFWRRRDSPVHREGRLKARACPSSLIPTIRLSPRDCLGSGLGTSAH